MENQDMDEERALVLAKISEGSIGRAMKMSDSNFFENRHNILLRLIQLPVLSMEQALEMALEYSGKEKKKKTSASEEWKMSLFDLLSVWKTWYRDLLLLKVKGPTDLLINFDFSHKLKNISKSVNIDSLFDSFMILDQAQRDLLKTRNLDLMMENSLLKLRRLAGAKA